jgi:hypothetical protein
MHKLTLPPYLTAIAFLTHCDCALNHGWRQEMWLAMMWAVGCTDDDVAAVMMWSALVMVAALITAWSVLKMAVF